MKIVEITEARPGRKKVEKLYHGTSSAFLPSIKKHGLLPDTGNKSYGLASGTGYESYGGVYLTNNINTAIEAAEESELWHKGEPVIITVQYVLGSGGFDEDFVLDRIFRYINLFKADMKYINPIIDIILRSLSAGVAKPTGKLVILVEKLIESIQNIKSTHDINNITDFEDYVRSDPEIRNIVKQIMEISKNRDIDDSDGLVRVTRPIKFKGKTRITDIIPVKELR